jgi:hypothetical protein
MRSAPPAFPVLDEVRASAATEGVLVEARILGGHLLRFAIHRLALAAVVATLLDAGRRLPPGQPVAPAAMVGADAVGIAETEDGQPLLVLETGGSTLSYALPAASLAALGVALRQAFPLPGGEFGELVHHVFGWLDKEGGAEPALRRYWRSVAAERRRRLKEPR